MDDTISHRVPAARNGVGDHGHLRLIVSVFESSYIKSLSALANHVNYTTHRLRMCLVARAFLREKIKVLPGNQSPTDAAYAAEVRDFALRWHQVFAHDSLAKEARKAGIPKATIGASQRNCIETFFTEVHGGFDLEATHLLVYVGDTTITPELIDTIVNKVADCVCEGMLVSQFPTPSDKKWTCTGPCGLRIFLANQGQILGGLLELALRKVSYEEVTEVDGDEDGELDRSYAHFKACVSKNSKTSKTFLKQKDQLAKLPCLLVNDEGNRHMTHRHLHFALAPLQYNKALPTPMQIYTNEKRSHIYQALVGWVAIVRGTATRLIMIWRYRGCDSMLTWFRQYPAEALRVYRASSSQAAIVSTNQRAMLQVLEILSIGDPDMPCMEAVEIIRKFARTRRSELGDGVASYLWDEAWKAVGPGGDKHERVERVIQFMMDQRLVLGEAFAFVWFSVGMSERTHAQNKQAAEQANQDVSFARMSSVGVNRSLAERGLKSTYERAKVVAAAALQDTSKSLPSHGALEDRLELYTKAMRAADLHRVDWLSERRALGLASDCCTEKGWSLWRAAWDSQLDEDKASYYALADIGKQIVETNKLVRFATTSQVVGTLRKVGTTC